jgi:hypothetical protein
MSISEAFNITGLLGDLRNSMLYNFTGIPPCESYYGLYCTDVRSLLAWLPLAIVFWVFTLWVTLTLFSIVSYIGEVCLTCASALGLATKKHTTYTSNWDEEESFDDDDQVPEHTAPTRGESAYADATSCKTEMRKIAHFLSRYNLYGWDTPDDADLRLNDLRNARERSVDAFEALLRVRAFLRDKARKTGLLAHAEWESKRRKRPRLLDGSNKNLH